jgi:predicted lipopolysaccharide heptosyltransferase III
LKILVLQLKRIGDLILTTPALVALRRHLPEAQITLAVEDATRELLPAMDYLSASLVYDRRGCNGPLWRKLIFSHFDVCLDFTGNDRSALFSVLSKARVRATFQWVQRSGMRAMFYNRFIPSAVRDHHTADHYLHLLRAVGFEETQAAVTLHPPEWAEKKATQLLREAGVEGPFLIVHPGTARPEKYWVPERWAEVIGWVKARTGLEVVITGSKDVYEQEQLRAIKGHLTAAVADLSGRMDLLTLGALVGRAQLVLSVDSAAMHLAAAQETPQVALFGPTNPFHWRPRHSRAVILTAGDSGGEAVFKPHHERAAMSDLSTARVTGAIESLLDVREIEGEKAAQNDPRASA